MLKKNGKAYRRLMLSFACIFLFPLGMSLLFYLYAYHTVRSGADVSNARLLNTVKSTCDREMSFYENTLIQLSLNQTVQKLASVKGEFDSENSYDLYALKRELESMLISINKNGDYCKDVFVYFQNSGKMVSSYGCMSFDMYCELYCGGGQAEIKEELRHELSEFHFQDIRRMDSCWTQNGPEVLMTMSNLRGDYGSTSAMVGLWLDMESLNQSVESVAWEPGLEWLMLDPDGISYNRTEKYPELQLSYEQLPEKEEAETEWQGENYIVRSLSSDVGEWKYVLLMSEQQIRGQAAAIRNVFFVLALLCMCVGLAAARKMAKANYSPLQKVLNLFPEREEEGGIENEYQFLEKNLQSFLQERSDFRQKVAEDWKMLRQYYLADLLENPYVEEKDSSGGAAYSEGIRHGYNQTLLLKVKEGRRAAGRTAEGAEGDAGTRPGPLGGQQDPSVSGLKRFIIRNVFEEGLGEYFRVETVELGESMAMILNVGENPESHVEVLAGAVDSLQKFIRDHFGFSVAVFAGEAHEGLAGVHESWLEAREAEGFIDTLDEDYISYREIRNSSERKYDYSQEQEEKIISALASHNVSLAVSYINKVLDTNFLENKLSSEIRKCLLYDLAGTLMKASEKTGQPEKNELGGVPSEFGLKDLSASMSLDDIREKFCRMAEQIGREKTGEGSSQNQILCQEVLAYIRANYSDPDLNISQTGQHFRMTPAYLSSIFRKETGESLLKVITMTRVSEAEKLLKAGASVVEAGEKVGFRDSSTFIRTFKKYTGVTPGQIKGTK